MLGTSVPCSKLAVGGYPFLPRISCVRYGGLSKQMEHAQTAVLPPMLLSLSRRRRMSLTLPWPAGGERTATFQPCHEAEQPALATV